MPSLSLAASILGNYFEMRIDQLTRLMDIQDQRLMNLHFEWVAIQKTNSGFASCHCLRL